VLSTKMAYEEFKLSITNLLYELQSKDALAISLKQKVVVKRLRNTSMWQVNKYSLLRHRGSVYILGDSVKR
jgi:hypothetical protein